MNTEEQYLKCINNYMSDVVRPENSDEFKLEVYQALLAGGISVGLEENHIAHKLFDEHVKERRKREHAETKKEGLT